MTENYCYLFQPSEPRYKVLEVSLELFLDGVIFNTRLSPDGTEIRAIRIEGLPDNVAVQAMVFDPLRRLVLLRLWSPDFPRVEEGDPAPQLDLRLFLVVWRKDECTREETPLPRGGWF